MDPDSFYNWDDMDLTEDLDGSTFLSGNFDRSAFTEAILHPSVSIMGEPQDTYYRFADNEYSSDMWSFTDTNTQVKQEPGLANFVNHLFQPDYPPPNSYVCPRSVTPNYSQPTSTPNYASNSQPQMIASNSQPHPSYHQTTGYSQQQQKFSTSSTGGMMHHLHSPSPSYGSPHSANPIDLGVQFGGGSLVQSQANSISKSNNPSHLLASNSTSKSTHVSEPYRLQRTQKLQSQSRDRGGSSNSTSGTGNAILDISIEEHPPVEVRTRTPGENRTFSLKAIVLGSFRSLDITAVAVKLHYANIQGETPRQTILGGTKAVPITDDGSVVFDNLCMTEASTKHAEKEFCLGLSFIRTDGHEIPVNCRTNAFYAYSHKKVLTRRKNIALRALSKQYGPAHGGGELHLVGTPFIKGPSLKCVFKTPHGDMEIKYVDNLLDRYSETVLFFELPPYPRIEYFNSEKQEIQVSVLVTNDGRHYSNELPFIYYAGNYDSKRVSAFR